MLPLCRYFVLSFPASMRVPDLIVSVRQFISVATSNSTGTPVVQCYFLCWLLCRRFILPLFHFDLCPRLLACSCLFFSFEFVSVAYTVRTILQRHSHVFKVVYVGTSVLSLLAALIASLLTHRSSILQFISVFSIEQIGQASSFHDGFCAGTSLYHSTPAAPRARHLRLFSYLCFSFYFMSVLLCVPIAAWHRP